MNNENTNFVRDNIEFEGCRIFWTNFAGKPTNVNPQGGQRSFCVELDAETAERLAADGWNVKTTRPRDVAGEEREPTQYLPVEVSYKNFPPHIYACQNGNAKELSEENVGSLDDIRIENVDLVVRPYNWKTSTGHGVKAYVSEMYVTLKESTFSKKYNIIHEDADEAFLPF